MKLSSVPFILLALAVGATAQGLEQEYPSDYTISEPVQLTRGTGKNEDPCLLRAKDGTIYMAWFSDRSGDSHIYLTATKDALRWSEPVAIIQDGGAGNFYPTLAQTNDGTFHPQIAQRPDGTFILVWTRYKPGKDDYLSKTAEIYYALSTDGTTWSDPMAITHNDYTDSIPEVYSNMNGSEFFVAWCSAKGSFDLSLSDVTTQPRHPLGHNIEGYSLRVLPLTDKDYLVVWVRKTPGGLHIYSCQMQKPH